MNGDWTPQFAPVVEALDTMLQRAGSTGAAVCVYKDGHPVVDVWGGCRNEAGAPWLRETTCLCFSTGKGVASTLLHLLIDDGLADLDDPVATHWPAFAQHGKQDITIRQVLSHQAGLHRLADWLDDLEGILDWSRMVRLIEGARPAYPPGSANGYHGFTYSWLAGELVRRIGGAPYSEQVQSRLAVPLGLDGLFVGLPLHELSRRARLEEPRARYVRQAAAALQVASVPVRVLTANRVRLDELSAALLIPPSGAFSWDGAQFAVATVPSSNGVFTARSLARMYALWVGRGELDGVRLMDPDTVERAVAIQSYDRDRVMFVHNQWRLGFHALRIGRRIVPGAFGHSGYRGTGGFACPEQGVAFAFVHNAAEGRNPMGGGRLAALSDLIVQCA